MRFNFNWQFINSYVSRVVSATKADKLHINVIPVSQFLNNYSDNVFVLKLVKFMETKIKLDKTVAFIKVNLFAAAGKLHTEFQYTC